MDSILNKTWKQKCIIIWMERAMHLHYICTTFNLPSVEYKKKRINRNKNAMRKCSLKMKTDWKSGILIKIQNISHTNNIFVASNNVYTYYCESWSTMANVNPARGPFENFIQQNKKKHTHFQLIEEWFFSGSQTIFPLHWWLCVRCTRASHIIFTNFNA